MMQNNKSCNNTSIVPSGAAKPRTFRKQLPISGTADAGRGW